MKACPLLFVVPPVWSVPRLELEQAQRVGQTNWSTSISRH